MSEREAVLRVPAALRTVGAILIVLAVITVAWAGVLYAQLRAFSFFSTYLSDMGNTPVWPQVVFNTGMLLGAPVRYLFLVLLVTQLAHMGAGRAFTVAALTLGGALLVVSLGMFAVPFGLHRGIHLTSALIYFFANVGMQLLIAAQEWRRRLPFLLPVSALSIAAASLVFAALLALVGRVEGITRDTPVIWEWLTFCAMMFFVASHAILLGRPVARK